MAKLLFFILLFSSPQLHANVLGSDIQNFNPTPNGLGFVTVHPSSTLDPLQLNMGLFMDYTTNSLAYSFGDSNDTHLYSNLHLAMGLLKGWDLGFSTSFIHTYEVNQNNFLFSYGDPGINEFRINSKVRLVKTNTIGLAVVFSADIEQIQANPFTGNNAGPSTNFEAVADWQLTPRLLWAVNFGYRLRQEGTPIPNRGITPINDQWIYSSALSYRTDDHGSAVIGELYGSVPLEFVSFPADRQPNTLEGLLGYRWRTFKELDIHGGVGTKIINGLGSPDFRFYLGVNWRLGFLSQYASNKTVNNQSSQSPAVSSEIIDNGDDDGDGVPNPIDQCSNSPSGSTVDEKGCVGSQSPTELPAKDSDGDGIPDELDRCGNTTPGSRVNGFGCEISEFEDTVDSF